MSDDLFPEASDVALTPTLTSALDFEFFGAPLVPSQSLPRPSQSRPSAPADEPQPLEFEAHEATQASLLVPPSPQTLK
eukprot:6049251-Prymnesium_polylepis.1